MIDGSEKRNRQLAFELHVCEKRSNEHKSCICVEKKKSRNNQRFCSFVLSYSTLLSQLS